MKIVCISDIHGYLPEELPKGDVLVIAGDICPTSSHHPGFQAVWLEKSFNKWLDKLPFKDKVVIAGNHDWVFETHPEEVPKLNCHYLQNSSVVIDGVKFYGYPETPRFCDWAFNRDPHELDAIVKRIPDDTNVLLTHGPAGGILDVVTDVTWQSTEHLGDYQLAHRIKELKELKLHVSGHIHSGHGIVINEPGPIYVNASYINEQYKPDYDVITIDI